MNQPQILDRLAALELGCVIPIYILFTFTVSLSLDNRQQQLTQQLANTNQQVANMNQQLDRMDNLLENR